MSDNEDLHFIYNVLHKRLRLIVIRLFTFVPFCLLLWKNCFHQLLISQSVLTTWIVDRHLGHLCVVDLNLSMQKGMRQQPAMQLQKGNRNNINKYVEAY